MRWAAILSTAVATLLAACHPAQSVPASADPTTVQDTDGVIARFTNDIFPGATAWSYGGGQDGTPAKKFRAVVDPSTSLDVHDKVMNLGVVKDADGDFVSGPDNTLDSPTYGLHLTSTSLTSLKDSSAFIVGCYTYTDVYYPNGGKKPATRPGASEATFALHKTDNWYLSDITDDHVVPGCQNSKA